MIILDTDVLSAIIAPGPVQKVIDWLDRQVKEDLYLIAVTIFEIRTGIDSLPEGKRRREMEGAFGEAVMSIFGGRVLPFDAEAASEAGRLAARRRALGRSGDSRDTQIAGIALSRRATLATRNVRHFSDLIVPIIDPWTA